LPTGRERGGELFFIHDDDLEYLPQRTQRTRRKDLQSAICDLLRELRVLRG
jgi:hypothetical protein